MKTTKIMTVKRVDAELLNQFSGACRSNGSTITAVVKAFMEEYVKRNGKKPAKP